MQSKFTLKNAGNSFRLAPVLFALFCLFAGKINAQQYINGNLSTGPTSSNGTAAPAGTTWSEVQAGNINAGFTANISAFTLADNFTIACGSWNVTKITFFAYSTGYAGAISPFNDVRVRIFNTDPSVGAPVPIFGDLTTNRFLASTNSTMYRIFNATPATNRILWRIEATVPVNLTTGNYWVEWGVNNTVPLASNFTPASTVVGTVTQPGNNGKQHTIAGNTWANALDGASPQDFHFIIDYTAAACTGTPAPGNTLSTVPAACPTIPFTLSLQNCIPGTGVTYQWQSATAIGGPYSNIVGATSSTLTTTLTATTFYQALVTCGANTGTSTPVSVALTPPSGCYCIPPASDCTDDDVITRVLLSTLDNASTCSAGPPAGYANYTALPAPTVYSGAPNPIRVEAPTTWTEQVAVWIDYNKNGIFEVSEFSNIGTKPAGTGFVVGNINIPTTALNGNTRMRVRCSFATALTGGQACVALPTGFGETEDYTVNITPCIPAAIVGAPASVSIVCGSATSFTVNATGTLLTYSWQYRTSAAGPWQTVTAAAPYAGLTGINTATLGLPNVIAAYNGYQFRALVTGGCSAVDFSTPPATLTVTPIIPTYTTNPSPAIICAGSVQQLSLTNSASAPTTVNFTSGPVSIVIPESPGGVASGTSTIAVAGIPVGAIITSMKVTLNMTHNWVGDVCYVLKAPNSKVFNLDYFLNRTGNGGTNFANTVISSSGTALLNTGTSPGFTGTFAADAGTGALIPAAPAGPVGYTPDVTTWGGLYSTPNGNYTLAFFDYFVDPDPGTFTRWNLEITYESPVLVQGTWTGPAGTMWTNAGATIPYTGTPATTIWVTPAATTNYQVSFVTASPCTSATATIPVTVVNPVVLTTSPVNRTVCVGGSTSFSVAATGGPITYQWQVSTDGGLTYSNISGATASTYNLTGITQSMTGYRYRAVLSAAPCAGSTNSAAATLTVNALPIVTLSSPDLLLTPGQVTSITASSSPAAAAGGWVWNYNGSTIVGNTTNTVSGIDIDEAGTYHATVTDVNGCVNTSADIVIGSEASDHLWIYPNPNDGVFQVRYYYDPSSVAELRGVYIYNAQGQLVESREFALTNAAPYVRMDFDLSRQSRGTYVVKVVHKYTGKIVSGLVVKQ